MAYIEGIRGRESEVIEYKGKLEEEADVGYEVGEKTLLVKGEYAMDEAAEVGLDESYPELLVVEYL